MLTSKPGLGVAHRTWTPEAENEMAAVPPMSEKVSVAPVCAVDVVAGTVEVEEIDWVVGAWVGADWAGGDVVDGDDGWVAGAVLDAAVVDEAAVDEVAVACVAPVDDVDGLVSAVRSGSVVLVAPADATSVTERGATT